MADGRLGKADLAANTDVAMFTVPSNSTATVNVNLCNRTNADIKIRIAVRDGAAVTNADYIEYDYALTAFTPIERTGIVMSAGETLVCRASAAGVSARVHGFVDGGS